MQFNEAKIDFINWLEFIKDKSPKTSEQYLRHLNKFEDYLIATGKNQNHIENIDLKIVNDFRVYIHKNAKKAITIKTANAYMITLRAFFKYLEKQDIQALSPTKIDLIKNEERKIEFLTEEELQILFESISGNDIKNLRDLAIMKMIYSTGLRISELIMLNKNDINLASKEFAVR